MLLTENVLIKLILEELSRIEKWEKERGKIDKERVYDDSYKTYYNPEEEEGKIVPRSQKEIEGDQSAKEYFRLNADHDFFNNEVVKIFWNGAVEKNWLTKELAKAEKDPNKKDVIIKFIEWADGKFNIGALNRNEMSCVGHLKTTPYVSPLGIFGYVLDGWVTYASAGDAQSEFTSVATKKDIEYYKHSGLPKRPNIKSRIMLDRDSFVEPDDAAGGGEGMGDKRYNELLIDNSKITAVVMDFNHSYWKSFDSPDKFPVTAKNRQKEILKIKAWCDSKGFGFLDTMLKPIFKQRNHVKFYTCCLWLNIYSCLRQNI